MYSIRLTRHARQVWGKGARLGSGIIHINGTLVPAVDVSASRHTTLCVRNSPVASSCVHMEGHRPPPGMAKAPQGAMRGGWLRHVSSKGRHTRGSSS